jgi:hypothetical protein
MFKVIPGRRSGDGWLVTRERPDCDVRVLRSFATLDEARAEIDKLEAVGVSDNWLGGDSQSDLLSRFAYSEVGERRRGDPTVASVSLIRDALRMNGGGEAKKAVLL